MQGNPPSRGTTHSRTEIPPDRLLQMTASHLWILPIASQLILQASSLRLTAGIRFRTHACAFTCFAYSAYPWNTNFLAVLFRLSSMFIPAEVCSHVDLNWTYSQRLLLVSYHSSDGLTWVTDPDSRWRLDWDHWSGRATQASEPLTPESLA